MPWWMCGALGLRSAQCVCALDAFRIVYVLHGVSWCGCAHTWRRSRSSVRRRARRASGSCAATPSRRCVVRSEQRSRARALEHSIRVTHTHTRSRVALCASFARPRT
eukprot:4637241-Prymnesium_polylepis.1